MSDVDHGIKLAAAEQAIHRAIIWSQTFNYLFLTDSFTVLGGEPAKTKVISLVGGGGWRG
jgi:hypothetical protein